MMMVSLCSGQQINIHKGRCYDWERKEDDDEWGEKSERVKSFGQLTENRPFFGQCVYRNILPKINIIFTLNVQKTPSYHTYS
jgi:hypothetical protein